MGPCIGYFLKVLGNSRNTPIPIKPKKHSCKGMIIWQVLRHNLTILSAGQLHVSGKCVCTRENTKVGIVAER